MTEAEKTALRDKLEEAAFLLLSVSREWGKCSDDGDIACNCRREGEDLAMMADRLAGIAGISLEVM